MCVEQNIIKQQRLHPRMKLETVCVGSTPFFNSVTQHWIKWPDQICSWLNRSLVIICEVHARKLTPKLNKCGTFQLASCFSHWLVLFYFLIMDGPPSFQSKLNSFFWSLKRVSSFLLNLGLSNSFLQQNVCASGYESRSYTAVVLFKQKFCFPTLTCDCCY